MNNGADWLEVSFAIDPQRREWTETQLENHGALAVTLSADGADEVLEPGVGAEPLWQRVTVRGLFSGTSDPLRLLADLTGALAPDEMAGLSLRRIADQPWERAWLEHFHTMTFGAAGNLCICPADDAEIQAQVVVRLDPGLAFGTGTHATTALCLDALADHPPADRSVLDYGCGSGILAIAASALGAVPVVAVDNDPQALEATRINAARNGVPIEVVAADDFDGGQYDLVVANILANVLIEHVPRLGPRVRPGGQLLLSGILVAQAQAVIDAYAGRFGHWRTTTRDGWVALEATAVTESHVHPVP